MSFNSIFYMAKKEFDIYIYIKIPNVLKYIL